MKRLESISILIFGGFAVLMIAMQTTAGGMCKNTLIAEARSPDGRLKAATFVRDCGATTWFDTRVLILQSNQQLPDTTDQIFWVDHDVGKIRGLRGADRAIPLKLHWDSDTVL
jgi:hypothetical protein